MGCRVRTALDVCGWDRPLLGGRVWRHGTAWIDLATGAPVQVRAWAIGAEDARCWVRRESGALDAWVIRRGGVWVGVRVDVLAEGAAPWLEACVDLDEAAVAEWTGMEPPVMGRVTAPGDDPAGVPWRVLARRLRETGLTPVAAGMLSHAAPEWGPLCVRCDGAGDDALRRLRILAAEHGIVRAVISGPDTPSLAVPAGRGRAPVPDWEERRMREADLLDVFERLDRASDEQSALEALCALLRERLAAAAAGAATGDGRVVARVGSGDVPPSDWLATVSPVYGSAELALAATRVMAVAVVAGTDHVGVLWATWAAGGAPQGDALQALGVCARLAGSRLAACRHVPAAPAVGASRLRGDSPAMRDVRDQLTLAARSPFPVLLLGESGCGKELAARTVHESSPRCRRRFVAVNCAALPDDLLEAELFGHVRGAFSGATADRAGMFEEADQGTLFLDEIGELTSRAQAKLLRALQEGEVRRVGENTYRHVDVRLIAATNVALEEAVASGRFRADLFYRIAVVCMRLPPLRERPEDIPALAQHFWAECTRRVGSRAQLSASTMRALSAYDWPGNVRQLQNVLASLAVRAPRRGVVTLGGGVLARTPPPEGCHRPPGGEALDSARRQFEMAYVRDALVRAGGRRSEAARELGVSRQGLSKLVRRLGLESSEHGSRVR
jgi:DNA-binding NtrC family response regulator